MPPNFLRYCQARKLVIYFQRHSNVFHCLTLSELYLKTPGIEQRMLSKISAMVMSQAEINDSIKHRWEIDQNESISADD